MIGNSKYFDSVSTVHNPNEVSILQPRASLAEHSFVQPHMTFTPLGPGEAIKEGDLVGLDAEFVSLNKVRIDECQAD